MTSLQEFQSELDNVIGKITWLCSISPNLNTLTWLQHARAKLHVAMGCSALVSPEAPPKTELQEKLDQLIADPKTWEEPKWYSPAELFPAPRYKIVPIEGSAEISPVQEKSTQISCDVNQEAAEALGYRTGQTVNIPIQLPDFTGRWHTRGGYEVLVTVWNGFNWHGQSYDPDISHFWDEAGLSTTDQDYDLMDRIREGKGFANS